MSDKQKDLYIFVEGPDDTIFFDTVIRPHLEKKYRMVPPAIEYATKKKGKIIGRIKAIKEMNNDYLFFSDIDITPCISQKKEKIKECLSHQYDADKTFIVIKEIESWYLAGLDEIKSREFFVKNYKDTNDITKEMFSQRKKLKYDSELDFKIEILKHFSIETACRKNESFKYFYTKFFKTED